MRTSFHSRLGVRWAFAAVVAVTLGMALPHAAAQQPEIAAIEKRYRDLFAAGKYTEALRRSMLAFMEDKGDLKNAYPAFWAPFAVIGEGAAR